MPLGKIITLDEETRKLYSNYNFKYFLDRHLSQHQYPQQELDKMHTAYATELNQLKKLMKANKRQGFYYVDGMIRKCHSGGFLPALFNLDESRGSGGFLDFYEIGKTWAYFDVWRKAERRKFFKKNFWDTVVKTGAILGFILSVIKIIEVINT